MTADHVTNGIERIRQLYSVPAKRGMRIRVDGRPGRITGARAGTMHLWVRFDGDNHSTPAHPTWRVDYSPEAA